MAVFEIAYDKTLKAEGGYRLTNIKGDNGQQTYAGISRKFHPTWGGWAFIDRNEIPPTDLVRGLYRVEFWEKVRGESIISQDIANNIYDFAVNTGVPIAIKLAQMVAAVQADGVLGPKSLMALNSIDGHAFKMAYALAKVARYRDIIKRKPGQKKFITGWLTRTLEAAS